MCGRYMISTDEENIEIREILNEINERFRDTEALSKMKPGEIFPTNIVPVITLDANNEKVVNLFKWGFPNFRNNGVIINVRGETVDEKPTFRKSFHSKRCLIPASGFFEWKLIEDKKIKHLIRTANRNFFYMAGIYNSFEDKLHNPYTGFVIITTDANEEMAQVHDRMPVILTKDEAKLWLQNDQANPFALKSLLQPYNGLITLDKVG